MSMDSGKIIAQALEVLDVEAQAVLNLKSRIDANFVAAVEMVYACKGKVIFTGIGKSGQIARKISSTMTSTGTPSVFLHPAEAAHGDLGLIAENDLVIAVSYGGESPEMHSVLKYIARKNIQLISLTGKPDSSMAKASNLVLNIQVDKEACPLNLAPTASSTATLAMGDALAMSVLRRRGFKPDDFAMNHPGGSLGYRLLTKVSDVMHRGAAVPLVQLDTPVSQVLSIMTSKDVRGAAGVLDQSGQLVGIITDGDIRRLLEKSQNPLGGVARDIMSVNPRTISSESMAEAALSVMETHRIQLLFVVDREESSPGQTVGVVHIQDLLKAKVR
jgi:arabinose-5-phosphate isomerase